MRSIYLIPLFCCFSLQCFGQLFPQLGAQRAGISALTFLKMEVSPRSAGLASANVCLTGDAYATYSNPSALAEVEQFQIAASNTFWVAGINYAYLTSAVPTKFGTLGFSPFKFELWRHGSQNKLPA